MLCSHFEWDGLNLNIVMPALIHSLWFCLCISTLPHFQALKEPEGKEASSKMVIYLHLILSFHYLFPHYNIRAGHKHSLRNTHTIAHKAFWSCKSSSNWEAVTSHTGETRSACVPECAYMHKHVNYLQLCVFGMIRVEFMAFSLMKWTMRLHKENHQSRERWTGKIHLIYSRVVSSNGVFPFVVM